MNKNKVPVILLMSGLVVVIVYLASAIGLIKDTNKIILSLVFAIGPVAIVGVLNVADRLSTGPDNSSVQIGKAFLIIGFALFTLMLVVQQTIFLQFDQFRSESDNQTAIDTLNAVFKGVNLVQLGIDVAFDIFYCVGVIFFATAMYRHQDFGRFIGSFGIISATGLLVLNLTAFPYVPSESGLIDLGPLTGVWWLLVISRIFRLRLRDRRNNATSR